MKFLLLFESFLESNYSPLYRYVPWFFKTDMEKDMMSCRIPADENAKCSKNKNYIPRSCICFTRSVNYSYDGSRSVRIKLDQNKLRKDGYIPYPIDEFRNSIKMRKLGKNISLKYTKKSSDDWFVEWEYEERIYKDIKSLGKYIISIQLPNNNKYSKEINSQEFKNYLKKYPHIKLEEYDINKRWLIKEINE